MRVDEAMRLLGLPLDSFPSQSQVRQAYIKKVWESHPDRFPAHEKLHAESQFKLVAEAYSRLQSGTGCSSAGPSVRVVRYGVPRSSGRSNSAFIKAPFLLLILGTMSLGGFQASRAYRRQKAATPTHNPFLP